MFAWIYDFSSAIVCKRKLTIN
uniref:Uncharacterized protein n=1 Tax=Rhizophora mucronata TaxID=61149 RepID=A0A2P2NZ88_RHIMU